MESMRRGDEDVSCKEKVVESSLSSPSNRCPLFTQYYTPSAGGKTDDSFDLAMDGLIATSIEQLLLYNNVYEMESSDQSPSRLSFLSYGDESRIDSELRFLAGVDYGEVTKEDEKKDEEVFGRSIIISNQNQTTTTTTEKKHQTKYCGVSKKPNSRSKSFHHVRTASSSSTSVSRKTTTPTNQRKLMTGHVEDENSAKVKGSYYLGPYLLKQAAKTLVSSSSSSWGDDNNHQKALDFTLRALKYFEASYSKGNSRSSLELVMCLHIAAALYCRLGRYEEAIQVLERSIEIPVMDRGDEVHLAAKFAGCMQLGDTYAMQGEVDSSIPFYTAGLEIQRKVLGEKDPRVGDTCRYVAEAQIQAMQFDEAKKLGELALEIHRGGGGGDNTTASSFVEEAADRRLLGMVYDSKGDYETALEQYILASVTMAAARQHDEKSKDIAAAELAAAIDCNIGDAYLSLSRYNEAICSYQKAITMLKNSVYKGDQNHPSIASVYVHLANLYNKMGRFKDSKSYCQNALRVYCANPSLPEVMACGLAEVAAIYESMGEPEEALDLLHKAIKAYGDATIGPHHSTLIAGIEAQVGVLYYTIGDYSGSYNYLKIAIDKFRLVEEKKEQRKKKKTSFSAVLGIALNQMGLTCLQLFTINEAADCFEEARFILEAEHGPCHVDTLGVYSNLAATYDAMGRTDDAIEILEFVVGMREDKLGTANPDVDEEKRRLAELLKEAGRVRNRKAKSLEALLGNKSHILKNWEVKYI
ncbi:unnamed protein product [Cuscuta europaea]|uniref:Uncharacterized protein n=1 Tax=Cuscuta europaea TaxID=41803 RepID=A0A9P1DZP5_CUSEU|nr:unnamed protein product [Cuscuta europaea]